MKVAEGTRLVGYPASRSVLLHAISEGFVSTLVEAGAAVCAPGCGFCIGRTVALGDEENAPSTQNRNFLGRIGNNSAEIYLSSVETAAVSVIRGEIADPRETFKFLPDVMARQERSIDVTACKGRALFIYRRGRKRPRRRSNPNSLILLRALRCDLWGKKSQVHLPLKT